MKTRVIASLFVGCLLTTACSSEDPSCGDGVLSADEECDDGASADGDGCAADCTIEHGFSCTDAPSNCSSSCGDNIVSTDEECDNSGDEGCSAECQLRPGYACEGEPSTCSTVCNDGIVAGAETCDDGDNENGDGCDAVCQEETGWSCDPTCQSICGDGLLRGTEECDDMGVAPLDGCDANCAVESTTHECDENEPSICSILCAQKSVPVWGGAITNSSNPLMAGAGLPAVWEFGGQVGITAGDDMCKAIGADHVCSYSEVLEAHNRGELSGVAGGSTFWLHRTVTESFTVDGAMFTSPPGAGGRCNDWTYGTGHIADSESFTVENDGSLSFVFDRDTAFTANPADGHAGGTVSDGTPCGGFIAGLPCCLDQCVTPRTEIPLYHGCDENTADDLTNMKLVTLSAGDLSGLTCIKVTTGAVINVPAGLYDWLQGGLTDGEIKYHDTASSIRVPLITSSTINANNPGSWIMNTVGAFPFFHETNPGVQRGAVFVVP